MYLQKYKTAGKVKRKFIRTKLGYWSEKALKPNVLDWKIENEVKKLVDIIYHFNKILGN